MLNISFQLPIRFGRGFNTPAFVDRLSDQLEMIRGELAEQDARIADLENGPGPLSPQPAPPIDFLSATVCEHCKLALGTEPTIQDTMGKTYHRECAEKLVQMYPSNGGTP